MKYVVLLKAEDVKDFFHFRKAFPVSYELSESKQYSFEMAEKWNVQLEDLLTAMQEMQHRHIDFYMLDEEWLYWIKLIGDQIGVPAAMGKTCQMKDVFREQNDKPAIDRTSVFWQIFSEMDYFAAGSGYEPVDCEEWIHMAQNVLNNENKPMDQWELTVAQKFAYIRAYCQNNQFEFIPTKKREAYKKWVNELSNEGYIDAAMLLAEYLNGGNTLFPCNYDLAREMYERMAPEEETGIAATELGIMYKYGQGNSGIPMYDDALRWLSAGSSCGVAKAAIELSDMYINGMGVPCIDKAAYHSIGVLYTDLKKAFADGVFDTSFPETAERMGFMVQNGIYAEMDAMIAHSYFLEAQLALRLRRRVAARKNDDLLEYRIQAGIETTKPEKYEVLKKFTMHEPVFPDRLLGSDNILNARVKKRKNYYELILSRVTKDAPDEKILFTQEDCGICVLTEKVHLHLYNAEILEMPPENELFFDRMEYVYSSNTVVLLFHNIVVMAYRAEKYKVSVDGLPDDELQTYASVYVEQDDAKREYECDIDNLSHGDQVIVEKEDGSYIEGVVATVFKEYPSHMNPEEPILSVVRRKNDVLYA